MRGRDAKFIRSALPFFTIVLGGAWGLHYFQQVRFDFRKNKKLDENTDLLKADLVKSGVKVRENVTVDSVYKEVAQLDTDNWENIRGPRDTEDLTQYNKIKVPLPDAGDSPPEPDSRDNTSNRGVRGSPVPSTVSDPVPDPFWQQSSSSSSFPPPIPPSLTPSLPSIPLSLPSLAPSLPSSTLPSLPSLVPSFPSQSVPVDRVETDSSSPSVPSHPIDPSAQQADQELLSNLLELGFEESDAKLALVRTANTSVEAAVQWIVERSNESDFEEEGEGEEEDDPMGGTSSLPIASGRTHKMVLVANTSLKMGTGKLAAQVGHATLAVYRNAVATEEGKAALDSWRRHGEVKIVVKGESTEQLMDLFKAAKDAGLFAYLVQDAGYTQIPPGSRTVLGVFGPVNAVDAVTGHLKLL